MVSINTVNPKIELPEGIIVDTHTNSPIVLLNRQLKSPMPLLCAINIIVGVAHPHPNALKKIVKDLLPTNVSLATLAYADKKTVTLIIWIGEAKENAVVFDTGLYVVET
jgi:hypothetical protein